MRCQELARNPWFGPLDAVLPSARRDSFGWTLGAGVDVLKLSGNGSRRSFHGTLGQKFQDQLWVCLVGLLHFHFMRLVSTESSASFFISWYFTQNQLGSGGMCKVAL